MLVWLIQECNYLERYMFDFRDKPVSNYVTQPNKSFIQLLRLAVKISTRLLSSTRGKALVWLEV